MEKTIDPAVEVEAAPAIPKARKRWAWKPVLKYSVAAGILGYLLQKVPFGEIWAAILTAKWELLAMACLMTFLVQWTTADRLRRLLKVSGNLITTREIFEINISTLFYGLFLPGGNFTGIAIRFYRLSAEKQNPLATGVALFTDRVISTITLLLVGILFWLPGRSSEGWVPLLIMGATMVALILTIVIFLAAERIPVVRPLYKLLMRYGGKLAVKIHDALHNQSKLSAIDLLKVTSLSILTHLLGVVAYYFIARSLGIEISWIEMGWVRSSIILATMIPLTPSGIGLREGASLLLLTSMGVAEDTTLAFSLLVFGTTILLVGIAGGICEFRRLVKF